MMMERAKTAPAPDPREKMQPPVLPPVLAPAADASAEERVHDLERRLNLLDDGDGVNAAAPAAPAMTTTTTTAPATPASASASNSQKSNPLLKRIQAAQERARLAESEERRTRAADAAESERRRLAAEEASAREAEAERIATARSALRSVAGRALEEKQRDMLAQLEGRSAPPADAAPAAAVPIPAVPIPAVPIPAVPVMKSLDTPPPSFDSMKFPPPRTQAFGGEMVGHGMNSSALSRERSQPAAPPPPSFDLMEERLANDAAAAPPSEAFPPPPPTAPSAPPPVAEEREEDHLRGVRPVAPPPFAAGPASPPPSFAEFESTADAAPDDATADDAGVFEYDLDGNPLSPRQRQELLDEQRRLYESIMCEKSANDAAIAAANADAFDMRSSSAAARAMPGGTGAAFRPHAERMDAAGRDVAGDGREGGVTEAEGQADPGEGGERRLVDIGSGQTVALHGQDRTKRAIKEGTAVLVQCMNCQNWMQVTDTATLMFCPVCQVVSPVIRQNEVMTKEEAIQLTMDRKLAEKLQRESYDDGEEGEEEGDGGREGGDAGYFSGLFGGGGKAEAAKASSSSSPAAGVVAQSDSWWDKISSIVSYGVAEDGKGRSELGVTRPPGAGSPSKYPAQRGPAVVDDAPARPPARDEETHGLLSPAVVDGDGGGGAPLPGRVAESKPLFSCVMDAASSAALAVFSGEGNAQGVDESSLLVTNAGRGVGDGAGDYEKLPDR